VIPAIILAAGASSRMGRTKALLPLPPGDWFLGRLHGTLLAAGVEEIIAVIGHDTEAIEAAVSAANLGLRLVRNRDASRGQLSSLIAGLDALPPGDATAVLVTPVDLPLVSAATVRRVLDAWKASGAPIVRPERRGRHGHPVIFGASILPELRAADLRAGARPVIQAHRGEILDVPVDDDGAFEDIDTPEDYARIVKG
jgi:molybdenum cofactor cytidylyltransferase